MNTYKMNGKFIVFSIIAASALVGFSLFFSANVSGFTPSISGSLNGTVVTENIPLFGCDIGAVCGASCTGSFRNVGQGTGWSVNQDGKRIFITNQDASRPNTQTLSIAVTKVDVDDDGHGDGWSKDTCRGGGAAICSEKSGSNCAGTIYPNNEIWHASTGNAQTRVVIDGTATNKLKPNGTSGIWGGFNAQYVVKTLVCNSGFIIGSTLTSCVPANPRGNAPVVQTLPATDITTTSAVLNGWVNPSGSNTNSWFEYGTSTGLGNSTAIQQVGSGGEAINVSKAIFGLTPDTTYYFRIVGENLNGVARGQILNFKTNGVILPTHTPTPTQTPYPTHTPTPTPTSTPNNGQVYCTPGNQTVRVGQIASFTAFGGNGSYTWVATGGSPVIGSQVNFSTTYSSTGLKTVNLFDSLNYNNSNRAQCFVNVIAGTPTPTATPTHTPIPTLSHTPTPTPSYTPTPTATPNYNLPSVETVGAKDIRNYSAVLFGKVNPNNTNTQVWFEYGTSPSSLSFTSINSGLSGNNYQDFSRFISNLESNRVYYFRAVASNSNGTVRGNILSFVTNIDIYGEAPLIETRDASYVSLNAAIFNSYVNPRGFNTTAWFEYGTSNGLGTRTEAQIVGNVYNNVSFSTPVSGLSENTTYYFRVVAQNQFGFTIGKILTFKTSNTYNTPTIYPTPTKTPYPPYYPPYTPKPNPTPANVDADISCFRVNPSLNPAFPKAGQEFTYTVTFKNDCKHDFNNVSLKITLPQEVEFLSTNVPYFAEGANTYVYNVDRFLNGTESSISIRGKVRVNTDKGDTLIFSSSFNFTDWNGKIRSIVNNLMDSVGEGQGFSASFGAGMGMIYKGFANSGIGWLFLLILVLIILFFIYLLASEKRHQERMRELEYQRIGHQTNLYQK